MEIKIAYGHPIPEERLKRLRSISKEIRLFNVVDLIDQEYRARVEPGLKASEREKGKGELDAVLRNVEVLYSGRLPPDLIKRAPKLRWLQYVWNAGALDLRQNRLAKHRAKQETGRRSTPATPTSWSRPTAYGGRAASASSPAPFPAMTLQDLSMRLEWSRLLLRAPSRVLPVHWF